MGYSKSPRAVKRVQNYLDEMLRSESFIEWAHEDPHKLAYWINDGLAAARANAIDRDRRPVEPFASYSRLKAKYIIKIKAGKVVAEPRDIVPLEIMRSGMGRMIIRDVSDALEILGAVMTHNAPDMFFPDGQESAIPQLYAWGSRNGYFIIPSDDGITLTQTDPGDIAWAPESQ